MRTQAQLLLTGVLVCLCGSLAAQTQPPHITAVSPLGAARGTKVTVTIEGINLAPSSGIQIEGDGIQTSTPTTATPVPAKNASGKVTVDLTIARNALPGRRAIRLSTPFGASDLGYFVIDKYPVVEEKEPNNTRETAQEINIASPITFVGRIDPGEDVDYLKFSGKKGQTLIADVQAARIGSALDSVLILQDSKGRELAQNEDYFGSDSFLAYTFPADGTYLLKLFDLRYQGGGGQYYRLSLGIIPNVITGIFPAGGTSGTNASFDLSGYNRTASGKASLSLPKTDTPTIAPIFLPMGNETSYNSVRVQTGTVPELREIEPNDTPDTAQRVTIPAVINGRIYRTDSKATTDRDYFRFHAEKGQVLSIEVTARRLGSPMDSFVTIMDRSGKELASNDDADGKDSRIDFTAPETGDYIVQVSELTQRMGENFVYRLSIAPPLSDYSLAFTPDTITIGKGGRVPLRVTANRVNGFNEPSVLTFPNLPQGVQIIGTPQILAGQNEANLVLTANANAPLNAIAFSITGTATRGGKPLNRSAAPLTEFYTKNNDQIVRNTRPSALPILSTTTTPDLIVTLSAETLTVNQGKTAELTIKIARAEGFKAKVPLLITGLPTGVSATPAEVPENQSEVKITIKAEGNAAIGTFPILCTVRVVFDELRFTPHLAPPFSLTVAK